MAGRRPKLSASHRRAHRGAGWPAHAWPGRQLPADPAGGGLVQDPQRSGQRMLLAGILAEAGCPSARQHCVQQPVAGADLQADGLPYIPEGPRQAPSPPSSSTSCGQAELGCCAASPLGWRRAPRPAAPPRGRQPPLPGVAASQRRGRQVEAHLWDWWPVQGDHVLGASRCRVPRSSAATRRSSRMRPCSTTVRWPPACSAYSGRIPAGSGASGSPARQACPAARSSDVSAASNPRGGQGSSSPARSGVPTLPGRSIGCSSWPVWAPASAAQALPACHTRPPAGRPVTA